MPATATRVADDAPRVTEAGSKVTCRAHPVSSVRAWAWRGRGWVGFEAADLEQLYAMLRAPAHSHRSEGSSVMMINGELPLRNMPRVK